MRSTGENLARDEPMPRGDRHWYCVVTYSSGCCVQYYQYLINDKTVSGKTPPQRRQVRPTPTIHHQNHSTTCDSNWTGLNLEHGFPPFLLDFYLLHTYLRSSLTTTIRLWFSLPFRTDSPTKTSPMSKRKADEMTKPEQNACLSTSNSIPSPSPSPSPNSAPPFPFSELVPAPRQLGTPLCPESDGVGIYKRPPHANGSLKPSSRARGTVSESYHGCHARPDFLLVSCLILIYLELSWLILMFLRPDSRH